MVEFKRINQTPLYIIGDIHGRLDLLDQMIEAIQRDAETYDGQSLTVTLGDYIDRGPNSRGVLNRLLTNPFPGEYVALKGNHEVLLENFLERPEIGPYWWRLGGLETLYSFGIQIMRGQSYEEVSKQLRAALCPAHVKFLGSLKLSLTVGNFFLCHAGIRPGVQLDRQSEEDLLWIRDEFLYCEDNFGKIIVHGHTPVEQPDVRANRINIDTGAFATGRLTCLVVEGERYRMIST